MEKTVFNKDINKHFRWKKHDNNTGEVVQDVEGAITEHDTSPTAHENEMNKKLDKIIPGNGKVVAYISSNLGHVENEAINIEGGAFSLPSHEQDGNIILNADPLFDNNIINKGYADGKVMTLSGAVLSFQPLVNTFYKCGELTSLTLTIIPNSQIPVVIWFTCGNTLTTLALPSGTLKAGEVDKLNCTYEISIVNSLVSIQKYKANSLL